MRYKSGFLCLAVTIAFVGCTPAPQTPAELRNADLAYWTTVGEKFTNVEADLVSSETSYDQHESDWLSGDINTSLGEASTARDVAAQSPWNNVEQSLTAAADAMTNTLNDFEAGAQNSDASAMTKAYNDYLAYARNAIAATKEARDDYVREGGKASDIRDFYSLGSGGSDAGTLLYYVHNLQKKARTGK